MSNNFFRFAIRFLFKHKGYSTINILGLTLGLCACLSIYAIVSYEFSFDRIYPGKDRIYRIGGRIRMDNGNGVMNESFGKAIPAPAPDALRTEVPFIETLAGYYPFHASITIPRPAMAEGPNNEGTIRLEPATTIILAGKDYFDIFPYTWLSGSPAHSLDHPYRVVLTAGRARQYFGNLPPAAYINRELIYDDTLHVRVSGIIRDYDGNTDFPYTDFISFSTISHSFLNKIYRNDEWAFNPSIPRIQAFVKLSKNADPGQTAALFDTVWQRHNTAGSFERFLKFSMVLQPLSDIHFNEKYDNDGIRKPQLSALYGLIGAAVFILLLAIVNFINLGTAQSLQQSKDISIRNILGASQLSLISRSLTETAILTTVSAILALSLVRPVLGLFTEYLPVNLPFSPFSPFSLLFAAASIIVTTFLAGLYPAFGMLRLRFSRSVRILNTKKFTLRRTLIVFQFSVSLFFIMTSLVVGRQINYMLKTDMGFHSAAVLTVNDPQASPQEIRLFARQALGIPGVAGATVQGHPPAGSPPIQYPIKLDNQTEDGLSVNIQVADHSFIPFYHMKLVAGRNLAAGDSSKEVVINETYRKALGFSQPADAAGHLLIWLGEAHPIVGVVADFHTTSFHTPIPSLVIARIEARDNSVGLHILPGNPQTLRSLESLWKKLFPDRPFAYTFLDDSIVHFYKNDLQLSSLVQISTAVTIFVSCIGLLGLILFTVERRKKEISIRKVLGAGIADVVLLLNKEFAILVGIALLIASPVAFAGMHRWLQNYAYRITISWWIFVLSALIMLAISLLTISMRILRAALSNPADNLRSE